MANRNVLFSLFLGVLCLASCQDRGTSVKAVIAPEKGFDIRKAENVRRVNDAVLEIALNEVGQREVKTNWSPRIKQYLAVCGIRNPAYWCGAFTAFVQDSCGLPYPDGCGWTPNWFTSEHVYWNRGDRFSHARPGTQMGIYFNSKKRIAHIGIIYRVDLEQGVYETIEGNATKNTNSNNGDGVYIKFRDPWAIYQMADWTK